MILYQNSIVKLDYNPATDILEVEYPDLHTFLLPEIKHTITTMIDVIKNYDVKKLLLDSSRTIVNVSEDESRDITTYLAAGLSQTRVEKLARVQSAASSVEKTAQNNIKYIQAAQSLPFLLQNFTSKSEALDWLSEN